MADSADQTFSDIIRGMQYAVNTAQETLQQYQFRQMLQYFNNKDGKPQTVFVTLSDGRRLDIPVITLLPQSLLSIDELEMAFKVQVAHTEVKAHAGTSAPGSSQPKDNADRSSFQVQFARRALNDETDGDKDGQTDAGLVSVRIKFKSINVPEGAARVLDALNLDIVEKKE